MIQAIKKFFLTRNIKSALRQKSLRKTVNYKDSKYIGVLFLVKEDQEFEYINSFIKRLEKEGKRIKALTYFENKPNRFYGFECDFFTEKEVTLFGNIKHLQTLDFIEQEFDFLYCVCKYEQLAFDLIMSKSKAKCRVGYYNQAKTQFFELMISSEQGLKEDDLIDQMLFYTKEIRA